MKGLKPILIVDDSEEDVELTIFALREENRITNDIEVIYDGEEALDYLCRQGKFQNRLDIKPALIILDLKMPKFNGFEILKTIKNDEQLRYIPVVIFTSSNEEKDIIRSYNNGANAFVVKPVDSKQFSEAIKQLGMFWGVVNVLPK